MVWTAKSECVSNGRRFRILQGAEPVSFRAYLQFLHEDQEFASWYTTLLADAEYQAFFWEHPAVCTANIDCAAEFVLLNSPALAAVRPEPRPFAAHFEADPERDIVSFRSLGGDALLLAPRPAGPAAAYPHLAAFVRRAPPLQVENLWHETGRAVQENLSGRNLWLSTSGLGVSWLHIRLDSYPKYYQHRPYTIIK